MEDEKFKLWESLKDSKVYRLSLDLGELVWKIVGEWDWFAKQNLGGQYTRSSDSVAANISEGWGKYSYKDKNRYFRIARGSLVETMNWTVKANLRELIKKDDFDRLQEIFKVLPWEINKLMYYNKQKIQ